MSIPEATEPEDASVGPGWSSGRATVYLPGGLPTLGKGRVVRVPARALELWIEQRARAAGVQ